MQKKIALYSAFLNCSVRLRNALQKILIVSIKIYRATLSNLCWDSCRFYPTCSKYTLEAIEKFGIWKGIWLCCKRLGRCHPLCNGGYDPVPEKL